MEKPYRLMEDIEILPSFFPIPGMGFLAVNAFIIKAKEPVLVDTGMGIDSPEFMKCLESIIDPQDLRWVWLTHDDADHTGNLQRVFEVAPNARLAANSLAVLRISTAWPVPMDRVYWINPGDTIMAGDHELVAVRPPLFDNPTTIGVYDKKSEAFFSADFFGGILPATATDTEDIGETDLAQGMAGWASADSPWIHMVESSKFSKALDKIRQIAPKMIFSAHLPPAQGKTDQLLKYLENLPASAPFVTPDQTALEQILAQMKGGT
ncbi:MAG: MBL fold metallo-hydrolase [Acidobacteriota bacterium]|jgi:flavorubredoxin